ncbi:MAG: hypothetical protein A2W81_02785 [Betaproteobacteria bacterium RIFCSPLOWO2_12_61_14]|nr:MAG: hypothetical protein A2W81_02785 [Betaproteobacteria bacterium RIFCSPLOWO2_12_61_14]
MPDADLVQQFEQRPFRCRDQRRAVVVFETTHTGHLLGLLVEQPLAVILAREMLTEPIRQARGRPAV